MKPSNCGTCSHWRPEGRLGALGFGICDARPDPVRRAAIVTSAQNICRIEKFKHAEAKVLREREAGLGQAE